MKAVVAAFNQEKALVGAFFVITNLWMEIFEALTQTPLEGGRCYLVPGGEGLEGGETLGPPHRHEEQPRRRLLQRLPAGRQRGQRGGQQRRAQQLRGGGRGRRREEVPVPVHAGEEGVRPEQRGGGGRCQRGEGRHGPRPREHALREHRAGAEQRVAAGEEERRGLGVREPEAGGRQEAFLGHLGLPGPALVLHRVLVHGALEALLESAGSALVAVSLVDGTFPLEVGGRLAGVHPVPVD